jgi:hypothetical protein
LRYGIGRRARAGHFIAKGQEVAAGMSSILTAAGFAQATFQAGSSGSDHLWIAVNDTPNASV